MSLFLSPITILGFDGQAAEEYGRIKAELEKKGTLIGPMDTLIASHARSEKRILLLVLIPKNAYTIFKEYYTDFIKP